MASFEEEEEGFHNTPFWRHTPASCWRMLDLRLKILTLAVLVCIFFGLAYASFNPPLHTLGEDDVEMTRLPWTYHLHFKRGPDAWPKRWPMCGGRSQSPVNLAVVHPDEALKPLQLVQGPGCKDLSFENTGTTFMTRLGQTCRKGDQYWLRNGVKFIPQYITLHSPSEHTVGGGTYDAEIQIVHLAPSGAVAILSVLLTIAKNMEHGSEELNKIFENGRPWESMRRQNRNLTTPFNLYADHLLPANPSYFSYSGSFTVPPCSENVTWVVFQSASKIETRLLYWFQSAMFLDNVWKDENARPVQPLNGRKIKFYSGS